MSNVERGKIIINLCHGYIFAKEASFFKKLFEIFILLHIIIHTFNGFFPCRLLHSLGSLLTHNLEGEEDLYADASETL